MNTVMAERAKTKVRQNVFTRKVIMIDGSDYVTSTAKLCDFQGADIVLSANGKILKHPKEELRGKLAGEATRRVAQSVSRDKMGNLKG